ncbi:MAG: hypothetical protein CMQ22_06420 [Gammaproteobacteria bacterium]|nr:hypothetical protein [Gammaproteobacteria bacterium]
MGRVIDQYLQRHAEPEAFCSSLGAQPALAKKQRYQNVLVIPAFAESERFLAAVLSHCMDADLLSIVVVNAPEQPTATEQQIKSTLKLLSSLKHSEQTPLLVIDRASLGQRIPSKQGVGLARKIGTDIALRLHRDGQIASPWLYQTDADARLPKDYFSAISPQQQGTVVFSHQHVSEDPILAQAAELYDAHMQYYVQALAAQGSAYAYPTLGSTIAVHADMYAKARGFPKRNAGEDFHLLNKLNKLAAITWLRQPTIEVQARRSTRVVFGTGPALEKIAALLEDDPSGHNYMSYDHRCFELLGKALNYLRQSSLGKEPYSINPINDPDHARVMQILQQLGLQKIVNDKLYQQPNAAQRQRLVTDWFDALKTLRFVHLARSYFPDTSLRQTLAQLPAPLRNEITF